MKNAVLQKWLSLILVFTLLAGAPAFVFAEEAPVAVLYGSDDADVCSPWAEFDIFMAEAAYGLGNQNTYSGFRGDLTSDKFMPVYEGMVDAFGTAPDLAIPLGPITRGEVITALYGIMNGRLAVDDKGAAAYFVEEKLMAGRASGDYELDKICTVEEMLVFAARAYEHIAYKADMDAKGFFWEVQGGANSVYLLGSIHISNGSMYPLSKAIEGAFAGAETLVVEANIMDMPIEEQMYLFEVGMIAFESGKTIKNFISAETYEMYVPILETMGFSQPQYDFMKPWLATMVLESIMMADTDMEAALGLDMYLMRKASMTGKDIVELEGVKFQYDLFNALSPELQEHQLKGALNEIMAIAEAQEEADDEGEEATNFVNEAISLLLEIVRTGDEEMLNIVLDVDALYKDPLEIEYNEVFIINRNGGMAEKIAALLEDGEDGPYFVVVGAAHMLGREGLVNLLRSRGYTVVRR